jgi:hypothetical protein
MVLEHRQAYASDWAAVTSIAAKVGVHRETLRIWMWRAQQVGGVSAADLLRRLGERVQLIHVKDGAVTHDDQDQVAVGSGKVDVLGILAAAPQALRVVELDGFNGDVFDALADSFAYLTANGVSA